MHLLLLVVAITRVVAAVGHLVTHSGIHRRRHLAHTHQWAEHCDAEVFALVLLDSHDILQLKTKPHDQAAWAYANSQPGAAAPAHNCGPEIGDSSNSIGVSDAQHWAAQRLAANPLAFVALIDLVVEAVSVCITFNVFHALVKCAALTGKGLHHQPVVANAKDKLEDQPDTQRTHRATNCSRYLGPEDVCIRAIEGTRFRALEWLQA